VEIIARLRAPDGCPWDREQTHASLREELLSECYEALEALDEGDSAKLCEELGDLLLEIVLQAQIAQDNGEFEIGDAIRSINEKIIRRHPHVFGSGKAKDAAEVSYNWEVLKSEEREEGASMLESVPRQMPALGYSQEVQRRVARVGFDWKDTEGVIDKLVEEVRELREAGSDTEKGIRRPAFYLGEYRPPGGHRFRVGPARGEPALLPPVYPHGGALPPARADLS
jgi:tetrapyrrole methylase family protein/MazG family protein